MAFLASAAYAVQLHYALMAAVALAVILLAQLMRRCKPAWTCLGMLFHSHHDLTLWCSCAVSVHLTSAKPLTAGLFWAAYLFVAAVELDTVVLRLVAQSLCKAPIWLAWQTVRLVHSLVRSKRLGPCSLGSHCTNFTVHLQWSRWCWFARVCPPAFVGLWAGVYYLGGII